MNGANEAANRRPTALTVAGSDPSGGAGVQADLKTFHQHGVYGMSVITVLTVQNTMRFESADPLEPEYVRRQLEAVCTDIPPGAAKTGALGAAAIIGVVAEWARAASWPIVVDPVMASKQGGALLADEALAALVERLLPEVRLVTPNRAEAEALSGVEIDGEPAMEEAARRIAKLGPRAVLVKGGHVETGAEAIDILYEDGRMRAFSSQRYETRHTHGAGCTYSAAITAHLALGRTLEDAVGRAKRYVSEAIATAPGLGRGAGPLNHHAE